MLSLLFSVSFKLYQNEEWGCISMKKRIFFHVGLGKGQVASIPYLFFDAQQVICFAWTRLYIHLLYNGCGAFEVNCSCLLCRWLNYFEQHLVRDAPAPTLKPNPAKEQVITTVTTLNFILLDQNEARQQPEWLMCNMQTAAAGTLDNT